MGGGLAEFYFRTGLRRKDSCVKKFIFGSGDKRLPITALNLEAAIKVFKASVLFPEEYVGSEYWMKSEEGYIRDYDSALDRYITQFVDDAKIEVFEEGGDKLKKKVTEILLNDCIDTEYSSEITNSIPLLSSPIKSNDAQEKVNLPVVSNKQSLSSIKEKKTFREQHDLIKRKEYDLKQKQDELREAMALLQGRLSEIAKTVFMLETFMGIHEEVIQIQVGEQADEELPFTMFQQVLYMDEEIGIWEDGGLDIYQIDEFDKWIIKNYKRFLYKEKSICAFRVRRTEKNYNADPFINFRLNEGNQNTYFLIRNGDTLHRIYSEINIGERLFPKMTEYVDIIDRERSRLGKYFWQHHAEKEIKKRQEQYLYGLIVIQGLIERTDILGKTLRDKVSLFRGEVIGSKHLEFIRDDEPDFWLSDGKLSWSDFAKKNRESIKQGSRIVVTYREKIYSFSKEDSWRWMGFRGCDSPSQNSIYIVEEIRDSYYSSSRILIRYRSGDEVWDGYDYRERKRRVPFLLYRSEVLNYDKITADDCVYYEQNRLERKNYLSVLPALHWIRKNKEAETEYEKPFVDLIYSRTGASKELIRELIIWWKLKNKWRRAVSVDESKALRMIERKIKSLRKESRDELAEYRRGKNT